MSDILVAREARSNHVQSLIDTYKNDTIVVLKLNVVGTNKNPIHMRFMCQLFDGLIKQEFENKIEKSDKVSSVDGDYIYYIIKEEGNIVKEKTILLEDKNLFGRLVDIDVYNKTSISRSDMKCEMRRCLVCDNFAHICTRNQTHSLKEISAVVSTIIEENLTELILNNTIHAIYDELEMYPKFGLVSHRDSGSHDDMDYETFIKSIFTIKPYLKEFILYGVKGIDNPEVLQEIGLNAEKAMFQATNNINTQKGLIFALGLFLPALTKAIINNRNIKYIQDEIKRNALQIIGDYYKNIDLKEHKTKGDLVYLEYGVKGIRGEALRGFPLIFNTDSFIHLDYNDRNQEYMIHILSKLSDTTVISRKGFKVMKQVQSDMDDLIKKGGYTNNIPLFNILSETYKKQGISPGGASDLLVLKMILESCRYLICTDYCSI